jgi:hypothetical protein
MKRPRRQKGRKYCNEYVDRKASMNAYLMNGGSLRYKVRGVGRGGHHIPTSAFQGQMQTSDRSFRQWWTGREQEMTTPDFAVSRPVCRDLYQCQVRGKSISKKCGHPLIQHARNVGGRFHPPKFGALTLIGSSVRRAGNALRRVGSDL